MSCATDDGFMMADKKKLSVAEILAAARKLDGGAEGEAEEQAVAAGLSVVVDRCILKEWNRLQGTPVGH